MMDLLWLVPAAPLVGFLILFVLHDYLPKPVAAVVGAGSVGVSALAALLVGIDYYEAGAEPTWQLL
ncbi:MAG: hypothetical protein OXS50_11360, partial [Gammaproteobacteria bacterium]|nr:hypothetical protein [Gammaproteobacteria bacterium]